MRPSGPARAALALALAAVSPALALEPCVEFQVSAESAGPAYGPAVAVAPTGEFLVVWTGSTSAGDDTDELSIQARAFDADGEPVAEPFQVNASTTGRQVRPRVASGPSGFLVTWSSETSAGDDTDGRSIQARLFDALGTALSGEMQLNTYTTGEQVAGAVAGDADDFVVVWRSDGSTGTDADGTSIQARRVATSGVPMGSEFQVNVSTAGSQYAPRVAAEAAGGFVVAWREAEYAPSGYLTRVRARAFAPDATPAGSELEVATNPTYAPQYFGVAAPSTGGFVVVWTGESSIEGRRYDSSGSVAGGDIAVEQCVDCYSRTVDVSGVEDGGVLAVWEGMGDLGGGGGQAWDVHGRRLGVDDEGLPEFKVNTTTAGHQYFPAVAHGGSHAVVVWETDPAGSRSIVGRRLDAGDCRVTTTTSTTTSTLPTAAISARKLVLREARGGNRKPSKALIVSHDPGVSVGRGAGTPDDPTLSGATLRIVSLAGAFDLDVPLVSEGWTQTRRAYNFRGPQGRVRLKPGKLLKAKLRGIAGLTLPDTDPSPVLVVLVVGEHRLCTQFATARLDVRRRKLVADDGQPPSPCTEPPAAPS